MAVKSDNFLADLHKAKVKNLTYQDGMRFGLGLAVANLLVLIVLGGLAWGAVLIFHIH